MNIAVLIIIIFFASSLIGMLIPTMRIAVKVYRDQLVRTSSDKWQRVCSYTPDKEQVEMYDTGLAWEKENHDAKKDVETYSGKFHLCGEYFDFGFNKAVIIIAGRSEGCTYSYYFAKPYKESGFNVLVIDNRAHGFSDGKYNSVGLKEYRDIIAWAKLLHDELNNQLVVCHGICIGSATALYAMTSPECPDYLNGMVAEGMFTTFFETFKNHMITDKRPLFPVLFEVMFLITLHSHVNPIARGPVKSISKMTKPLLMLHSRMDKFSLPKDAPVMLEKAKGPKELVFFDKGAHSHIRINNQDSYDKAIINFAEKYFKVD